MSPRSLKIKRIDHERGIDDWLAVPARVFANDPCWVPPLHHIERQRISPRHNPLFSFGEAAFFVAYRDSQPVGRISAQINRRHLQQHADQTGQFGFFDCMNDNEAAQGLVSAAGDWLRDRDMARMRGPFNLSINEDVGLLVSGFDTPPAILTSHAAPWTGTLLESCGLVKAIDLLAYRTKPATMPEPVARLTILARQSHRIGLRSFDMTQYARDVGIVFDIFNDAWRDNWGFVPFADQEIDAMIRATRPLMRGKFGRIVEFDGRPVAMMVVLPDVNSVITSFGGRLWPINWLKLSLAVWRDQWRTARIPLLGIRQEFRGTPLATSVLAILLSDIIALGRSYQLDWVEFSWILETNMAMRKLAELIAGPPCKTFRIYEAQLACPASGPARQGRSSDNPLRTAHAL